MRTLKNYFSLAATLFLLSIAASAMGAPPSIGNLSLRGLQLGGTTRLTITGDDLAAEPRLILPFGHTASLVGKPAKQKLEFDIQIPADQASGLHLLRLATAEGISNAAPVVVDALPQQPLAEKIAALPVAFSGSLAGSAVAQTSFSAKKGEPVVIDVEAQRLGSALKPVLHVYDSRRVQLVWAQGTAALADDARLTFTPPADATYTVELHDARYQAPAPGYFRLKIGNFLHANATVPAAVQRGEETPLSFTLGNVPKDVQAKLFEVRPAATTPAALPEGNSQLCGLRPEVLVTDHPQAVEQPSDGKKPHTLAFPSGVTGRLSQPGEEDRYRLEVQPGDKLRLAVRAEVRGSPLDGVLSVLDDNGKQLATADDVGTSTDPSLDFTVPANTKAVVAAIKDQRGRGGEEFLYHLDVAKADAPNFSLSLAEDRVNLPRGGTRVLRITANRMGYMGPIKLKFDGLPSGIEVSGDEIPAGANSVLCSLSGQAESPCLAVVAVRGEATDSKSPLVRTAQVPASPVFARQPWLRDEFAVAQTAREENLAVELVDASMQPELPAGGERALSVKVKRAEGTKGPVRLSLLTTQPALTKKIKEKVNNKDVEKTVADPDSMLRLAGEVSLKADAAETEIKLLVPANLPEPVYSATLVAQLTSVDGKEVLATAYSPVQTWKIAPPLTIELTGETKIEAAAGDGPSGKFTGRVVRGGNQKTPVKLVLQGALSGDGKVQDIATLTVPADKDQFELPVRFPYNTRVGDVREPKLSASMTPDPKKPQAVLRSAPLPVQIEIVLGEEPAKKPEAEKSPPKGKKPAKQ